MLRLLNRLRLRVYLAPGHVQVARLGGLWGNHFLDGTVLDCGGRDWITALDALDGHLADHSGAVLDIVFGVPFARLFVTPWDHRIIDEEGRESLARGIFEHLFSPARADDFSFVLDKLRFQRASCVMAVESALLAGIESLTKKHGLRAGQIRMLAAEAWNHFGKDLPKQAGFMLVVEGDRVTRLQHDGSNIVGIEMRPFQRAALSLRNSVFFAPGRDDCNDIAGSSLHLAGIDGCFAAALCGAA